MAQGPTAKKVKSWPLEKDPGCVFKGHVPQDAVPCRSSLYNHTSWVAATSQVLVPAPPWRSSKGPDGMQPYGTVRVLTEGDGICGL